MASIAEFTFPASPERRAAASLIGSIARHSGDDDPRLPALRMHAAALRAEEVRAWATQAAAQLPPLTPAEVESIAQHVRAHMPAA